MGERPNSFAAGSGDTAGMVVIGHGESEPPKPVALRRRSVSMTRPRVALARQCFSSGGARARCGRGSIQLDGRIGSLGWPPPPLNSYDRERGYSPSLVVEFRQRDEALGRPWGDTWTIGDAGVVPGCTRPAAGSYKDVPPSRILMAAGAPGQDMDVEAIRSASSRRAGRWRYFSMMNSDVFAVSTEACTTRMEGCCGWALIAWGGGGCRARRPRSRRRWARGILPAASAGELSQPVQCAHHHRLRDRAQPAAVPAHPQHDGSTGERWRRESIPRGCSPSPGTAATPAGAKWPAGCICASCGWPGRRRLIP